MVSGNKRMMILLMAISLMVMLLYIACEDSGQDEIKFEGEDDEEKELSRNCDETFSFLYDNCAMILYDAQGLPIDMEDAANGCNICQAGNNKYAQYCCIYDCANTYRECRGLIDCTHSCLGSSGSDDDAADDDTTDDDAAADDDSPF